MYREKEEERKGGRKGMKKFSFVSDCISHKYITASWTSDGPKSMRGWLRDMGYIQKKEAVMEMEAEARAMQIKSEEPVMEDHSQSQEEARKEWFCWSPSFRYSGFKILRKFPGL